MIIIHMTIHITTIVTTVVASHSSNTHVSHSPELIDMNVLAITAVVAAAHLVVLTYAHGMGYLGSRPPSSAIVISITITIISILAVAVAIIAVVVIIISLVVSIARTGDSSLLLL